MEGFGRAIPTNIQSAGKSQNKMASVRCESCEQSEVVGITFSITLTSI